MKREGSAVLGDEKREPSVSVSKIPPEHYTLEGLVKVIKACSTSIITDNLKQKLTHLRLLLQLKNFEAKPITLDRDLANIFGINRALKLITNVKRLRHPTSYFIHCDFIDKNTKLF